jgi:2,3-bisphosphoglycerate-independent phosphoglycerate mutase
VLLDGRDVPDGSAEMYVARLEGRLAELSARGGDYRIASGGGRMTTTMDRYGADWPMIERGWHAHVVGDAPHFPSALAAIADARARTPGISDQNLPSFTVADEHDAPVGAMQDGDAVIMFNFRGDRALEFSQAMVDADFPYFDRGRVPAVTFAGMCLYDGDLGVPVLYLVEPTYLPGTVSELLARAGVRQYAVAETQKFGHVTYFWNGNRSDKFDEELETYEEIPSDGHPFETRPWMKSAETADRVIAVVASGSADFVRANLAGGDMVGHTADFQATVVAIDSIDLALTRIAKAVAAARGVLVVTADHGNADDKVERDKAGAPLFRADGTPVWRTAHSLNPVPFWVKDCTGRELALADVPDGGLANVAATLLDLLGFVPPADYEPSLVTTPTAG